MLGMCSFASVHGKLLGGGVAFALAADWRVCSVRTTFNFGNLPHGVNPLFMLSRALPLTIGNFAGFRTYIEDTVISSQGAMACEMANKVTVSRAEAKHAATDTGKADIYSIHPNTLIAW